MADPGHTDTTPPTVIETLTRHALTLRQRPIEGLLLEATERAVIDWLGVAIGGSDETPARALRALGTGGGRSRLVGASGSADPSMAALINGTAAHTLELDDIYAPGLFHPGAPVVAAALAMADHVDAPGETFLRAVLVGYEVGCRVAADLGPRHYEHWHTTGTVGSIAAAAAAVEVLGAEESVFGHALALAATMSAGLQQTFRRDAMGKPLHAGHAAQAGVIAAISAVGGVTGALDALEGAAGLGAATGAPSEWEHSRAPVEDVLAIQGISVKPYPCCGHTFAVIDAVLELRSAGLRSDDVESVDVSTYRTAIEVAGIPAPRTVAERRFSISYLAATALVTGEVSESTIVVPEVPPEVASLMTRICLRVGDEFEAAFPQRRGASIELSDRSGSEWSQRVPDRSGSPQNPLTAERIDNKFLDATREVLGDRAPSLLAEVRGLREMSSVLGLSLH